MTRTDVSRVATIMRDRPSLATTTVVVVGVSLGWGLVRLFVFQEQVVPLTFVLPLLLGVWARRPWQLWLMAITFCAMAAAKYGWILRDAPGVTASERWTVLSVTVFNILAGAAVIRWVMSMRDNLEARAERIATQNAELEAQAEELGQQNEEIRAQTEELAQQNEEIEQQAEELATQNEELQEANGRLGSREEMLQAVVESSRHSAAGNEVLMELCRRALSTLGAPAEAIAVLELDGDACDGATEPADGHVLCLRAQAALETQPPTRDRWPLANSLARVVLKEDRTAYVDDLEARPDLAAPFTPGGSVRSLLVTPLRVGGKTVGVVAACARGVSHWTRDQFRLVEWIAAQTGLVVEGLRWQEALRARAADVEAANAAKDQFLAMLSHELRTPLTPVLAAAGALEVDARLPDDARDDVAVIRRNVSVQSRLIDDLLDLTRVSRGKLELHEQVLSVATLLHEGAAIVASDLDAREQSLTIELDLPPGCSVKGDAARLQQVIWNLLKNAVKFSPRHGRIALSARVTRAADAADGAAPTLLLVEVTDSGAGIEPDDLQRIFLPFEQAARKRVNANGNGNGTHWTGGNGGGLGLGLCIAKSIVELHGGTIRATSEGLGRGATFVVELPLLGADATNRSSSFAGDDGTAPSAQGDGASEKSVKADAGGAMRILLVEDHADTGRVLARLLRGQGHDVAHARDVEGAIASFRAGAFDLVVSDLGLPDGSGLDLMRQLKAERSDLTGICLSGYGSEGDVSAARDAGFAEHLTKPVDLQQLYAAIARAAAAGAAGQRRHGVAAG